MNPEKPSREEIEVKLTALLLGELPEDEARLLRWAVAQDPELAKLQDRLQRTMGFVREVSGHGTSAEPAQDSALKLSAARREKLLAHFKTPRPVPSPNASFWAKRRDLSPLITVLAVVAICAVLAGLMLPALSSSKSKAMLNMAMRERSMEPVAVERATVLTKLIPPTPPVAAMPPSPPAEPVAIALPEPAPETTTVMQTRSIAGASGGGGTSSGGGGVYSQSIVGYVNVPTNGFALVANPLSTVENKPDGTQLASGGGSKIDRARMDNTSSGVEFGLAQAAVSDKNADEAANPETALNHALAQVQGEIETPATPTPNSPPTAEMETAPSSMPTNRFVGEYAWVDSSEAAKKVPETVLSLGGSRRGDITAGQPMRRPVYVTPLPGSRVGVAGGPAAGGVETVDLVEAPKELSDRSNSTTMADAVNAPDVQFQNSLEPSKPNPEGQRRLQDITQRAYATGGEIQTPAPYLAANGELSTNGQEGARQGFSILGPLPTTTPPAAPAPVDEISGTTPSVKMDGFALNDMRVRTQASTEVPKQSESSIRLRLSGDAPSIAVLEKPQPEKTGDELAYHEATRKLDELRRMETMIQQRITVETIDQRLPKSDVIIVDTAEPETNRSLWEKMTGKYESKARIKVEKEQSDIALLEQHSPYMYDPYFIQTEFEVIQSSAVLGKVVDDLKLDEAWAKDNGGRKLDKDEAYARLRKMLDVHPVRNTSLIEVGVTSDQPDEAAKIANAVANAYQNYRLEERKQEVFKGIGTLKADVEKNEQKIQAQKMEVDRLGRAISNEDNDLPVRTPPTNAPIPQPEIQTSSNAFSTFSLNVSDVSFKLAAASLENGRLPDAASIRSEEFINAFDYRDPEAAADEPIAFTSDRARYPFAHNRDLLRFSLKTAAAGRPAGHALNLVLLLDNSGSMERADRVEIIRAALRVLATQLQPQDTVSIVTFARTARLWADGVPGDKAGETLDQVGGITPQGGTNLEEAMRLAYETARRHYLANGMNRVVLLTDGAANLGNVDAAILKDKVETNRKQGVALDCFGIGWEDYNDDLLEQLSSNGDGRYAFLNSPEDASKEFATKLAGALQVAAADVKVQVEFNPQRVISYRQIGYAKHQLTKEQFRDNTVDAAEIAAQEAGNALYTIETKPDGSGPVATVRVRYKVPGTTDYRERSWDVPYTGSAGALEQSSPAMRLAATAGAFSEWLAVSPFAQEVTPDELLKDLSGVPGIYGADERPKKLEWMIRQAKSLSGK